MIYVFFKRILIINLGYMYVIDYLFIIMIVLLYCSKFSIGIIYDYKYIYFFMFYVD